MFWLDTINLTTGFFLTMCYAYQTFYILYALVIKPKKFPEVAQTRRYAVMISARNEAQVIGQLIQSIRENDYPAALVDIHVVADNCTDDTAAICRQAGAYVVERFNQHQKGKGYALNYLYAQIIATKGCDYYDGYFVFDADNLLDKRYITEMDKCFAQGNRIITSYRNSKNYGTNWISSGYALWFLREAAYLNRPRFMLNTSCAISGTGFLLHRDILKAQNGWKHFLLTEDIEFSADNIAKGEKIAYCHWAMIYDEQPVTMSQSWTQRLRWSKGFLQVMRNYSPKLLRNIPKKGFSCFDILMTIAPAFFLTVSNLLLNLGALVYSLLRKPEVTRQILAGNLQMVFWAYLLLFVVGLITVITERKHIRCCSWKKVLSVFTFPVFIFTYIPISIHALFANVEWKPITHSVAIHLDDLDQANA